MIHKSFNFPPDQIEGFVYSKSAEIFTVKMKNNAVIHYQTQDPESFLAWLESEASTPLQKEEIVTTKPDNLNRSRDLN